MPAKKAVPARKTSAAKKSLPAQKPAKKAAKPAKSTKKAPHPFSPERLAEILQRLRAAYPDVECALIHRNPWELLVATILSAQCTDARVNLVTPELFRAFPTPKAMAEATPVAIEEYIRTTGFFRNKAKSIQGAAKRVVEVYGGKVPQTMDELLTLPGAARKTANVVLGVAFQKAEGVVVDTHVLRLSNRLGLTTATDPKKVEQDLMRILPRDRWIQFSHELIHHGRQVCLARNPRCHECTLETLCHSKDKTWSSV
jgi:endonuclease III